MKLNKDGTKHRHTWNAQNFVYVPTPAGQHMAETCEALLVRLTGIVAQKFERAYPDCPLLLEAVAALERLKEFSEDKGTPEK